MSESAKEELREPLEQSGGKWKEGGFIKRQGEGSVFRGRGEGSGASEKQEGDGRDRADICG